MTNRLTVASRKLISILAITAMVITSISFVSVENNAYAAERTCNVGRYTFTVPECAEMPTGVDENTKVGIVDFMGLFQNDQICKNGWYVVAADSALKSLLAEGNCNLIVPSGVELEVEGDGIELKNGASLTIWGDGVINIIDTDSNEAGIHLYSSAESGSLTINGCNIDTEGGDKGGAGIGGYNNNDSLNITINAGTIKATGHKGAAGIGGCAGCRASGNIKINNGTVVATGEGGGAGIGGGKDSNAQDITINGGTVNATGSEGGAGIGAGRGGNAQDITINNGHVTATGSEGGAGIGAGRGGSAQDIKINGGTVSAKGEGGGAGIGGGQGGSCSNVQINDGTVYAYGSDSAAAIGFGSGSSDLLVSDKAVCISRKSIIKTGADSSSASYIEHNDEDMTKTLAKADGKHSYVKVETIDGCDPSTQIVKYIGDYVLPCPDEANVPDITSDTEIKSVYSQKNYTLSSGWYVVDGSDQIDGSLVIKGDCNLILCDNCRLTCNGNGRYPGIRVENGASLTIWADKYGTGVIVANGGENGAAGIGGRSYKDSGTITINRGHIHATGGTSAAGIGGGITANGNNITINGGSVTATGGQEAAGIGGGAWGTGNNIMVSKAMIIKAGKNESSLKTIANYGTDLKEALAPKSGAPSYVSIEADPNYDPTWNNSDTPESTSIKSVTRLKKGFKVTWKKTADVTGYQVKYATNESMNRNAKVVRVKSAKAVSKKITNLRSNKRYYVKVRTYLGYTSNHSDWSTVKSVKTR